MINVLDLDARRKVYELVKNNPGCHFREMQRRGGMAVGSLKYHLDYLDRHGLLRSVKEGNSLRYFPADFDVRNSALLGHLRQESVRKIILSLVSNDGLGNESIADAVGLSPSTVSFHLKKLVQAKILEKRKRAYLLAADKDEIIRLLITYRESFMDSLVNRIIDMWEFD